MAKQKACPFCGSRNLFFNSSSLGLNCFFVECLKCYARGPMIKSIVDPKTSWIDYTNKEISDAVSLAVDAWKKRTKPCPITP